ncbi:hypothetical protein TRVL_10384 [Trypanosoma vivax]|uniref:Uncharacterized protein n=1 Tax=Trypanosoma vivax (strain Y486) TaxID=1055687 RepID=G0U5B5_TRYVY|nr:hypothetical protein TRVL_10384 [Trypanosoma vivax]CCC51063.1 conserved hypothetical protein [Trypanosoma vivax Y486]
MLRARCPTTAMDHFFAAVERRFPDHAQAVRLVQSATELIIKLLDTSYPYLEALARKMIELLTIMRERDLTELGYLFCGLSICLYGGSFTALIAAVEAVRLTSWERILNSAKVLYQNYCEGMRVVALENESEQKDRTVPNVRDWNGEVLLSRKIGVFLSSVDPLKVKDEFKALLLGFTAVATTLRSRSVNVITIGCSLSQVVSRFFALDALLKDALSSNQQQLAEPLAQSFFCILCIFIVVIARQWAMTLHSAMYGARLAVESALELWRRKGNMSHDCAINAELPQTQTLVIVLASVGVFWQFSNGFSLPFPLNILLLPLRVLDFIVDAIFCDTPNGFFYAGGI